MRIHFQAVPWDLYAATAYSVLVSVGLLAVGVGSPLGLVLILFVPGYLASSALLPRKGDADALLRLALSVGLSLALAAFAGLVLNFTSFGIGFASMTVALLVLSLSLASVAYQRRMAIPPDERLEVTVNIEAARWAEYSWIERILAAVLVAILATAIPLLGLALTQPRPTVPFTELYILGPTGNFTGYPTRLNVSEPGTVQVVVANHEAAAVSYTLRVDLEGVRIVYNATSNTNDTVEVNRTTWSWYNKTLLDGDTWTQTYTFAIPAAGLWEIQFLLFRDGTLTTIYRQAALLVSVP